MHAKIEPLYTCHPTLAVTSSRRLWFHGYLWPGSSLLCYSEANPRHQIISSVNTSVYVSKNKDFKKLEPQCHHRPSDKIPMVS